VSDKNGNRLALECQGFYLTQQKHHQVLDPALIQFSETGSKLDSKFDPVSIQFLKTGSKVDSSFDQVLIQFWSSFDQVSLEVFENQRKVNHVI
jgi:hypothetical protein